MIWRIRDRATFTRLSREGRRFRAGALWCNVLVDSSAAPPRVAFALGRVLGSAPVRNRLRRRLRVLCAAAELPPGWYLIGASPAAVEHSFDELGSSVRRLRDQVVASSCVS